MTDYFPLTLAQGEHAKAIQGAIRHVLQKSQHISFVFSGNSRKMLSKIFEDDTQPLYMACDKIFLNRIEPSYYIDYIQSAAKAKWKKKLPEEAFNLILELTECHSFYINLLCSECWFNKTLLGSEAVQNAWMLCRDRELRRIKNQLESLSLNQRLLLKSIALEHRLLEPLGNEFSKRSLIPVGSIRQAIGVLYDKDYIFKRTDGAIRVLDPLIRFVLVSL